MEIVLENIGRRFNQEWIFKSVNYTFKPGEQYAILGPNGSGKSTLLQLISGSLGSSEGTISYTNNEADIDSETVYKELSLAAPYLDLIEELSLRELIDFHFKFKKPLAGINSDKVLEILDLGNVATKTINQFSSGMKQRTKLALAILSDTPLLILDEPTANFDQQGLAWYLKLIEQYTKGRLLIVGSNQETEYNFCKHTLLLTDYKVF